MITLILYCCPKEVILIVIGTCLRIGLKQFIQILFATVLAYHISFAAPDHQIEDPIQENNSKTTKRKIIDIILEVNGKLVVDKSKYDAKIVDKVGSSHPF